MCAMDIIWGPLGHFGATCWKLRICISRIQRPLGSLNGPLEQFLLSFGGGVCMLLYLAISAENKPALATTILKVAFMFIAIGFSCWLLDNFCCTHVHWLRLHVFWHIFTGLSGYMFTLFMITLRASSHQQIPSLVVTSFRGTGWELQNKGTWSVTDRPQFILPYVKHSKKCDGQ